jgi:hypothetical protein
VDGEKAACTFFSKMARKFVGAMANVEWSWKRIGLGLVACLQGVQMVGVFCGAVPTANVASSFREGKTVACQLNTILEMFLHPALGTFSTEE